MTSDLRETLKCLLTQHLHCFILFTHLSFLPNCEVISHMMLAFAFPGDLEHRQAHSRCLRDNERITRLVFFIQHRGSMHICAVTDQRINWRHLEPSCSTQRGPLPANTLSHRQAPVHLTRAKDDSFLSVSRHRGSG